MAAEVGASRTAADRPPPRPPPNVVEELLGGAAKGDGVQRIKLHGTDVYLEFDASHHCASIYAVGTTSGNRALSS